MHPSDDKQANNMPYNPFNLTKVWYHDEFH